jgi:hypothetical protein
MWNDRTIPRTFLIRSLGLSLLAGLAGCSASGIPSLVKISPDSRLVVCEDCRYPRVYLYDVEVDKRYIIRGKLAFLSPSLRRLVLIPDHFDNLVLYDPIRPTLVQMTEDGAVVSPLPPLPAKPHINEIYVRLDEEHEQAEAIIYRASVSSEAKEYYTLSAGGRAWSRKPFPDAPFAPSQFESQHGPIGAQAGGYVYCPTEVRSPNRVGQPLADQVGSGLEVTEKWSGSKGHEDVELQYKLVSPDGAFEVTIGDLNDQFRRVWLIRTADHHRTLLLDKDDAALEILGVPTNIVMAPVFLLIGPI